jgi:hypothetical protein
LISLHDWQILYVVLLNHANIFAIESPHAILKRQLLLFAVFFIIALAAAEVVLRKWSNIVPGVHTYSPYFTQVDSLVVYSGYHTDEDGIFKPDEQAISYCKNFIRGNETEEPLLWGEIKSAAAEMKDLRQKRDSRIALALEKHHLNVPLSSDDSILIDYFHHPLNEEGFRSMAFNKAFTNRPKILLIGDSFTWGHSASSLENSFTHLLLEKGYTVWNTGISGADPAQYLAIARKYIPLLKPDAVIVNFYLGNDVEYYKRQPKHQEPLFYYTNAGPMYAHIYGTFIDNPLTSYSFIRDYYSIPLGNGFNRFCAATATGTLLWKALHKSGFIDHCPSQFDTLCLSRHSLLEKEAVCNDEMVAIKTLCENEGAYFGCVVIPFLDIMGFKTMKHFENLLPGISYRSIDFSTNDFDRKNSHYNNQGHKKHAALIEKMLKEAGW